jgi:transcriptional regulator with AAA-type ATPase domain
MSTTHPSASTGHSSSAGDAVFLRWVFPSIVITPLAGKHTVGRDEECDTVLAGTEISRRHAEFRVDGPIVGVRDLHSRNGVFVNGQRAVDAPLALGDVVRCGEWVGVVSLDGDRAALREIAPGWYGGSALLAAADPARRTAVGDLPVIVQGETGTGKEGMARAIHGWSQRRGPFLPVNCSALPEHLVEAELFGYRKGAFTGSERPSQGLFRAAQGGTVFLDEILDLPPAIQPKLLRVLEQHEVLPLGETMPVSLDVRVIAATQESLAVAAAERGFRRDLLARLDGLTVVLPPLRERREDVAPLFVAFLREHSGGRPPDVEAKLVEGLCLYDWPLNVRELLLLARRLLGVYGHEAILKRLHLPERIAARTRVPSGQGSPDGAKRARRRADDESEFDALVGALRDHAGSVAKAAAALGINRARAYRLLSARPDFSLDELRGGS